MLAVVQHSLDTVGGQECPHDGVKCVENLLTSIGSNALVADARRVTNLMPAHGVVHQFGNVDEVSAVSELDSHQRILVHLGCKRPAVLCFASTVLRRCHPLGHRVAMPQLISAERDVLVVPLFNAVVTVAAVHRAGEEQLPCGVSIFSLQPLSHLGAVLDVVPLLAAELARRQATLVVLEQRVESVVQMLLRRAASVSRHLLCPGVHAYGARVNERVTINCVRLFSHRPVLAALGIVRGFAITSRVHRHRCAELRGLRVIRFAVKNLRTDEACRIFLLGLRSVLLHAALLNEFVTSVTCAPAQLIRRDRLFAVSACALLFSLEVLRIFVTDLFDRATRRFDVVTGSALRAVQPIAVPLVLLDKPYERLELLRVDNPFTDPPFAQPVNAVTTQHVSNVLGMLAQPLALVEVKRLVALGQRFAPRRNHRVASRIDTLG